MRVEDMPLGLVQTYDEGTDTTTVSWSYLETSTASHFVLEYYDEKERRWKPYDGRNGLISR